MNKLTDAIELAMKEFKNECGEDAKLEEGDEFVTVFNDGTLIISIEDGTLGVKILAGKPYFVDRNIF